MRFAFFLVPFALAAACGGVFSGTNDGGADAGNDVTSVTGCKSAADCPSGYECAYPGNGGCDAAKQCFPPAPECKKLVSSCSCALDQMVQGDCNDAFQQQVTGTVCESPCGGGVACELCDVSGFAVVPMSKPETGSNQCTQGDISAFVTACLGASATQTTCAAWQQADAGVSGCGACILTPITSASWGPIVCQANSCTINSGGCIDLVAGQVVIENGSNGSCGDLANAANQCLDYACASCTTPSDSDDCTSSAEQAECKSYFDAEQTASTCALFDAGAGQCSPQNDAGWAAFINVFCGTGP